jgi:SAM-dependent methyltransferase
VRGLATWHSACVSTRECVRSHAAPAAERNKEALLQCLQASLADIDGGRTLLLEIGSGTGQHAAFCASAMPDVEWQPSEYDTGLFPSIRAWTEDIPTVREPLDVDVRVVPDGDDSLIKEPELWGLPEGKVDACLAVSVVHLLRDEGVGSMFEGMGRLLRPGGLAMLCGMFLVDGTAPEATLAFQEQLRRRMPHTSLKDVVNLCRLARTHGGMRLVRVQQMPEAYLFLTWEKAADLTAWVGEDDDIEWAIGACARR